MKNSIFIDEMWPESRKNVAISTTVSSMSTMKIHMDSEYMVVDTCPA